MLRRIRQSLCKHNYFYLHDHEYEDEDEGCTLHIYVIYCPKCRKEKGVNKSRYIVEMKKSEVDRAYARD